VSASTTGVELRASLDGVVTVAAILEGDGLGVLCRKGEGDAGLSGRRKGDARGEPYERCDGLYVVAMIECWMERARGWLPL